jgi:hypothetical protein
VGTTFNTSSQLSSDGTNVWVTNSSNGTVSQINCSSATVTNTITTFIDNNPNPSSINSDGVNVWILNNYANFAQTGYVTKINCTNTSIITELAFDIEYTILNGNYGLSSDGTNVWIASAVDYVIKINCTTNDITRLYFDTVTNNVSTYSNGTYVWVAGATNSTFYQIQIDPPLNIICFKENTKILTNHGYKPVEELRKGYLVKTLRHGFVPIIGIGKKDIYHDNSPLRTKNKLYKCDVNKYPELIEDLVITGCHCILVDNFISDEQKNETLKLNGDIYLTDFKYRLPACIDKNTSIFEKSGNYTVYHITLDNKDKYMNYGIYANGLLVESCSEWSLKEYSSLSIID